MRYLAIAMYILAMAIWFCTGFLVGKNHQRQTAKYLTIEFGNETCKLLIPKFGVYYDVFSGDKTISLKFTSED